jgi:cytochrome P450
METDRAWRITRYRDAALLLKSDDAPMLEPVRWLERMSARLGGAFPNLILLLGGTYPFQNGELHLAARAALKDTAGAASRSWTGEAMAALAAELIAPFADGREFDAAREIARAMPLAILGRTLGTAPVHVETLCGLSRTVSEIWHRLTPPLRELHALEAAASREVDLLRRTHGGQDSAFPAIAFLALAGVESTSGLLGSLIHVLAEKPQLQDRLRADPAAIPDVVNETLRLWPPLRRIVGRRTTNEIALDGAVLPRDAVLVIDLERAHRDADAFAGPDSFLPGRKGPPSLVFGFGAHACLGAALARLEARVLVETILRDFTVVAAGNAERAIGPDWNSFARLAVRLERRTLANPRPVL